MSIIQEALNKGIADFRTALIEEHCPYEVNKNLPDFDINTYKVKEFEWQERGCRGITCEDCWEKFDQQ